MSGREHREGAGRVASSPDFAAIGEIAVEIAHELRNALQIVSANVYLARQNPAQSELQLVRIERSARIAHGIVDDLMSLARGEALGAEPIPVEELLVLAREILPEPGADFEDAITPGLTARAHAGLGARLLGVLYDNAIRATAPRKPRIVTRAERTEGGIALLVSDDGPGIPPAIAARLFEPLVTSRPGGSGLGLALARRIVDAHRGTIEIVPSEGGAAFRIVLPD